MPAADELNHLLRRTEFVARPSRVAELASLSRADAVADVLDFAPNANPSPPAELLVHNSSASYSQYVAAYNWWVDSMVTRPRPFQEKLTLFWHGHFVSSYSDNVGRMDHMLNQNQLFRAQGLGNLRALTHAMAIQPAMLLYLSNASNVKGTPNQNFARELMELFTLGVGNYTEDDVDAAARAWTGHNYNSATASYEFRPTKHDTSLKVLFGRPPENLDGPDVIDVIFDTKGDVVGRFIARKLWEFLAYSNPADHIVADLGAVLVTNNFELRPLLQALLTRDEFYSTTAREGLVRTPTDYAVALCHHSGLTAADLGLSWSSERMGQRLFAPPNVAGWKSNGYWLNTSAISGRANIAQTVQNKLRAQKKFDELHAMTTDAAVDHVASYFGITSLSAVSRAALVDTANKIRGPKVPSKSWWFPTTLLTMTMLTPEFHVA